MNSGLLDVLHDATDVKVGSVEQCVDVDFDREVQEAVDQKRVLRANNGLVLDAVEVVADSGLVIDDFHAATAENE